MELESGVFGVAIRCLLAIVEAVTEECGCW